MNHSDALGLSKIFFIEGCSKATQTMNGSLHCSEWVDRRHSGPCRCQFIFVTFANLCHQPRLMLFSTLLNHLTITIRAQSAGLLCSPASLYVLWIFRCKLQLCNLQRKKGAFCNVAQQNGNTATWIQSKRPWRPQAWLCSMCMTGMSSLFCQPASVISVGCDRNAALPCCPSEHTLSHLPTHSHSDTYTDAHTKTHTHLYPIVIVGGSN